MTKFDFKQWIINNKAQNKRVLNENYNDSELEENRFNRWVHKQYVKYRKGLHNEGMCEDCGGMPHEGSCMGEGEIDEIGKGAKKAFKAFKKKFGFGESVNIEGIYDETMMTEEEFEEIMYEYGMVNEQFGGSSLSADNIATNFDRGTSDSSSPLTVCDPAIQGDCHAFSKCTAGHVDDGAVKNYITTQWGDPIDFWNDLGSPTITLSNPTPHVRNADGTVFIYKGIQETNLFNYSSTAPSGTPICGCNPGCTDPIATNYDSNATCDDGSCIIPPPGFSECQNCCCRSHMQAKIVGGGEVVGIDSDGNPIYYKPGTKGGPDKSLARENINPTIDAIYELMQLAEQRRRKPTSDREMEKSPYDFNPNTSDEGPILAPVGPQLPASSTSNQPAIIAGPCAMSHYPNGVGAPVGGYTPDPSFMIDPATGICECDSSDPNNIFGGLTMNGYMNLNPGTPNNTNSPNGTGAC